MQLPEAYAHFEVPDRAEDPEISSLGSLGNDVDPVTLVLSFRLLRSEAARAAALNQTAILNSKLAHMHVSGSTMFTMLAFPPVARTSEVMSEDGANMSKWGDAKSQNSQEIVRASATGTTRSVASSGTRSISSLPVRYVPHSPQRLKYSHRTSIIKILYFELLYFYRCHAPYVEQRPVFCCERSPP